MDTAADDLVETPAATDAYAAIKAINWSTLKHLAVSPLLYKWRLSHPEPRKPAFVLGGAVHCLVLEPERFDERYAVFDGRRDARSKEWQAWQAAHQGVESLKPDEMKRVNAMVEAVFDHRVAAGIICHGRREEALTWIDEGTGLACKGRLDYLRPDFLIDLKSTRDPMPKRFERAAENYGYNAQAAFYHDGAVAARRIPGTDRPYIVAVQSVPPFDVAVFQLEADTLAAGRAFYQSLLRRLVVCTEADYWPGVAPELQPLHLVPWASDTFVTDNDEDF